MSDTQTIEDTRAAIAALRAKRNQPDPAAELARLQFELEGEQARARFASELGPEGEKWAAVDTLAGLVCVRRPPGADFKRFSSQEAQNTAEIEAFAFRYVIFPEKSVFDRKYEERPGILGPVLLKISELAGVQIAAQAKK